MTGSSKRKNLAKKGKGRGRKLSAYTRFLNYIKREYGQEMESYGSRQMRAALIVYGNQKIPPRMPPPGGPINGASMTTTQLTETFGTSTGISSGTIYQSGATAVLGAVAFQLSDLDQVSTFSSQFDQYRIDRVHFRIRSKNTNLSLASTASPNQAAPPVYVVVDMDDASALSAISDIRQYQNCAEFQACDNCDVILEPSITPAVYASGAFSGYGVEGSEAIWLDVSNTSIPHYGIKFAIAPLQASSTYSWQWTVEAIVTVSFRGPR